MFEPLPKQTKILLLIAAFAVIFGMLYVVGCSNQQAENFTEQIMDRPHCIDAILALRAVDPEHPKENELTEIELRWILQSAYEACGLSEDEAFAAVNKLLNNNGGE
jgi:hypothetical protein